MDFPSNTDLVDGRFVNEDAAQGIPGSLIVAEWGNAVTDEILNVIRAAGMTPEEQDVSQLLDAIRALLGDSAPQSNRNYFVDGNFDSWIDTGPVAMPTTSIRTASTIWRSSRSASGAGTIQADPFNGNEPVGMTSPVRYALRHNQTTASTGTLASRTLPNLLQTVESVRTLHGRSATFSVWLRSSVSITIPGVLVEQSFGTGGSPAGMVRRDKEVSWTVTTAWRRFSVRLDIPSVAGRNIGTNGDDLLGVGIFLPPGVTFSIFAAQAQLEASSPLSSSDINGNGGAPTAFEWRGHQAELARVQRQYSIFQCNVTTAINEQQISYPVVMRSAPALTASVNSGSGAAFSNLGPANNGCYQSAANSSVATATVTADARV
ncbi:hypothetical protein [Paraburkholderia adhaesiva]|uniref:hypothetical protein n=1 Tax=Paraburkholderia adhaesiva TaxID=2883244 RepID=UPI001F22E9A0|nr:hypothetical protein [Paraburkholderia adhaesiva]